MVRHCTAVAAALLAACAPERPACSPAALAALEAAYVHEALTACDGETLETCTELPAIRAKYKAQRDGWVSCQ